MKKAQFISRVYIKNSIKVQSICSAFQTRYSEDFYFPGELHPYWEFVYVINGSIAASSDERIYNLHAGDIIFHKPMEFHKLWGLPDESSELLIISWEMDGAMAYRLENGVFSLDLAQKSKMEELINYLQGLDKTPWVTSKSYLSALESAPVSQCAANILESLFLSLVQVKKLDNQKTYEEPQMYNMIIEILMRQLDRWPTLDEIASECGMSKSQLKRVFSGYSGGGVHNHFVKLKIAEGMRLLLQGQSVADVSETLGFSSPNYFNTVFKRETGMTPLTYKKGRH